MRPPTGSACSFVDPAEENWTDPDDAAIWADPDHPNDAGAPAASPTGWPIRLASLLAG